MRPYAVLAWLGCLTGFLMSQEFQQKPYTEWSEGQVDQILNNSAWVGICVAEQKRGQMEALQSAGVLPSPLSWRVRLLTARPVREAFLAELSYANTRIKGSDSSSRRQAWFKEFMNSYPDDIKVKGDEDNIVVTVTLTQFIQSWVASQYEIDRHARNGSERNATVVGEDTRRMPSDWKEEPRPEKLMDIQLSGIVAKTSLTTKTGRKAALIRYERPAMDMLGAKFYFPRKLPDGTPLVTPADKELQFETLVDGKRVRVNFNLKKMLYKGRLEI
jgi:hypothetical protein